MPAPHDPNAPDPNASEPDTPAAPTPPGRRTVAERSPGRSTHGARTRREPPPAGPPPARAALHEAALAHLARFAATQAGLVRVLDRRIGRWARRAADGGADPAALHAAVVAAREAAREVAHALVRAGAVDDAAYAAARARSLSRAGRSRRAVGAHLAAKGVSPEVAQAALPGPEDELAAALAYARRRRLGPFRPRDEEGGGDAPDPDARRREIGAMARAGFPRSVVQAALRMDAAQAEALVVRLKRG